MIDTLRLHLTDYRIGAETGLIVQPSPYIEGSGELLNSYPLWRKETGAEVVGSKAFYNSDSMNITLNPHGLFVQFSIPKNYTGLHNYYSVGRQGSKAIVDRLEGQLAEVGIETAIDRAHISRLDSFRNVVAEEAYSNYHGLFALLQAKRSQRRDYGTCFLWHNTQQELCIYDKLGEMRAKGQDTSGLPENTIRFEHRLLNARKVENTLGVATVSDLWTNYDRVKETFLKVVGDSLFKHEVEDIEIVTGRQLKEELLFYKSRYGLQWFQRFLKVKGLEYLLQKADMETVLEVVNELSEDRKKAWRLAKELVETRFELAMSQLAGSSLRTTGQLYAELKRKVLAA